ncbi:MAG: hypothetical protein VB878_03430 [Pirellulaceae bacterium]
MEITLHDDHRKVVAYSIDEAYEIVQNWYESSGEMQHGAWQYALCRTMAEFQIPSDLDSLSRWIYFHTLYLAKAITHELAKFGNTNRDPNVEIEVPKPPGPGVYGLRLRVGLESLQAEE